MTNRKILIVDDDSELREALVEQLAPDPYRMDH
jgi:CheY-like chemotaxis protein